MCTVFFSNRSLEVGRQFSIWWVIYIELAFKNSRINNCNIPEKDLKNLQFVFPFVTEKHRTHTPYWWKYVRLPFLCSDNER